MPGRDTVPGFDEGYFLACREAWQAIDSLDVGAHLGDELAPEEVKAMALKCVARLENMRRRVKDAAEGAI
jgi:hypothetical protein